MTMYFTIGGRPACARAVEQLEHHLSQDARFTLPKHDGRWCHADDFCEFLVFLAGGAPFYEGLPISQILGSFCPNNERYDHVAGLLASLLTGNAESAHLKPKLHAALEHLRPHVVAASAA